MDIFETIRADLSAVSAIMRGAAGRRVREEIGFERKRRRHELVKRLLAKEYRKSISEDSEDFPVEAVNAYLDRRARTLSEALEDAESRMAAVYLEKHPFAIVRIAIMVGVPLCVLVVSIATSAIWLCMSIMSYIN